MSADVYLRDNTGYLDRDVLLYPSQARVLTHAATGLRPQRRKPRRYRDKGTLYYQVEVTGTARVTAAGSITQQATATGAPQRLRSAGTSHAAAAIGGTGALSATGTMRLNARTQLTFTDHRHIEPDWLLLDELF